MKFKETNSKTSYMSYIKTLKGPGVLNAIAYHKAREEGEKCAYKTDMPKVEKRTWRKWVPNKKEKK